MQVFFAYQVSIAVVMFQINFQLVVLGKGDGELHYHVML